MICGRVIDHLANSFKQGGGQIFKLLLSVGWTKLHQIWREQSSIIASGMDLLWYRYVTSFWNDVGS